MNQLDYTEWADTLKQYKAELEKELLAEVRAAKQELAELQRQIQEISFGGRYERDEDTLILSAPNIIIGNVDKSGNLLPGGSNIVIRGNDIALEGVGTSTGNSVCGGAVVTRARNVSIETVDPGIDGAESVAFQDSSFTVRSAAIGLCAENVDASDNGGVFTLDAHSVVGTVNITAESNVNVSAMKAIEDPSIEESATEFENNATAYSEEADKAIGVVESKIGEMKETLDNGKLDLIGEDDDDDDLMSLRMGDYNYDDRSEKSEQIEKEMTVNVIVSAVNMSSMAESKRIAKYLNDRAARLKEETATYETEATGSSVSIYSESVDIATIGADGKVRTCPGNGLNITSQHTTITAIDSYETLPDSTFTVVSNDISLDTCERTYEVKNDAMQLSKIEAKGTIKLNAKEIDLLGNDATYEGEGDDIKETITLTKGSLLYANFSNTHFDMADEEGRAQGVFLALAKDVFLSSYDVDKENRITPTAIAADGKVTMGANEVFVGSVVKDMKSDTVQLAAKNVNLLGEEKVNLQQEADKSHLLLDDNAELSGAEVKVVGKISLGGETKIDAKFTAGDVEVQNLKAASSITGPNLKDGMPIPGAAAPVQPGKGAELKALDALDKIGDDPEGAE